MPSRHAALICADPVTRERLKSVLENAGYSTVVGDRVADVATSLNHCVVVLSDISQKRLGALPLGRDLRNRLQLGGASIALLSGPSPHELKQAQDEEFDDLLQIDNDAHLITARIELALRARQHHHDLELHSMDAMALLELSQTLASSLDVSTILHEATLLAASVLQVERCAIILLDANHRRGVMVAASEDREITDLEISIDDYPELQNLLETSAPVIITDASQSGVVAEVHEILADKKVGAELLFPIIFDEQVVGTMFLRSSTPLETFDERRTSFGMTVASALGIAIRNARLFDSFRDHTKRVNQMRLQAERRMRSLQHYEDFFENAADGMMVLDRRGRVQYLNREGQRILGEDRARAHDSMAADILVDDSKLVLKHMLSIIQQGQHCRNIDLVALRSSGEERALSVSASPLGDGQGMAVLSFRDVTELREMQTELKTTKDFLENLIDSSVDGIVAGDLRGNILLFNKGAERIYGYNAPEVIGRLPVWRLYPKGIAVEIMRELRSTQHGGVGRVIQKRCDLIGKDGKLIPVNLNASIIYEDGVEVATVGLFSDLRTQLKIEQDLLEAQRRLIQSEKDAAVVELAGAAAHELNQPLTSIVGYAEMLQRKVKADQPLRKHIDIISREAQRMADIVRKIGHITMHKTKHYGGQARIVDLDASSAELSPGKGGPPRVPPAADDAARIWQQKLSQHRPSSSRSEATQPGIRLDIATLSPDESSKDS